VRRHVCLEAPTVQHGVMAAVAVEKEDETQEDKVEKKEVGTKEMGGHRGVGVVGAEAEVEQLVRMLWVAQEGLEMRVLGAQRGGLAAVLLRLAFGTPQNDTHKSAHKCFQ